MNYDKWPCQVGPHEQSTVWSAVKGHSCMCRSFSQPHTFISGSVIIQQHGGVGCWMRQLARRRNCSTSMLHTEPWRRAAVLLDPQPQTSTGGGSSGILPRSKNCADHGLPSLRPELPDAPASHQILWQMQHALPCPALLMPVFPAILHRLRTSNQ